MAQLDALETGAVAHIPDRLVILKTLRRYAESLGLPGDRLVLALVDLWPSTGPPPPPTGSFAVPEAARTGAMAATAVGVGTETLVVAPPARESRYTDLDTAAVPQVYVEEDPTASNPLGPPPIAGAYLDTGVHAAVGRSGGSGLGRPKRPRRPARLLRWLVILVGLAVLLGSVGLVIYALKPSWFHKIGIGQSAPTNPSTSVPATTAPANHPPSHGGGSPPTTAAHHPTGHPGGSAFTVATSGTDTATITVRGNNPTIKIAAVGGDCWVTVTADGQSNPEFASIISAGGEQDFPMGHSLTVQLGSSAGQATVAEGSKVLGTYTPATAPINVTFQSA